MKMMPFFLVFSVLLGCQSLPREISTPLAYEEEISHLENPSLELVEISHSSETESELREDAEPGDAIELPDYQKPVPQPKPAAVATKEEPMVVKTLPEEPSPLGYTSEESPQVSRPVEVKSSEPMSPAIENRFIANMVENSKNAQADEEIMAPERVTPTAKQSLIPQEPEESEKQILSPSRLTAFLDQDLFISLAREAWVYMGEKESKPGLKFMSKNYGRDSVSFHFLPQKVGMYELGFQKQNLSTGQVETVSFEVLVLAEKKVPEVEDENQSDVGNALISPEKAEETAIEGESPRNMGDFREYYSAEDWKSLISLGEAFLMNWPKDADRDELLYKLAMGYEALGGQGNVKKALVFYEELVQDFPYSNYYFQSEQRITYIKHHYFLIRQ